VKRLWIGGLALDYCVRATALDAIKEGFEVHVIVEASRAVNVAPGDGSRSLEEVKSAGGILDPTVRQ
jgi:nicotinamidase/pyrazinamidase